MVRSPERGFSLIEMLVSLSVLLVVLTGLASMMVENSKISKSEQMTAQVHANARNCLTLVVQRLRSAGWDPMNAGVGTVTLDADLGDADSEIEIFADLDEDGATTSPDEHVLLRHSGMRVVLQRNNGAGSPLIVLATNISNDADGDGTSEPMFVPDSTTNPTRVTVRVTARSPAPDPMSGDFIRYTVSSDVALRKSL